VRDERTEVSPGDGGGREERPPVRPAETLIDIFKPRELEEMLKTKVICLSCGGEIPTAVQRYPPCPYRGHVSMEVLKHDLERVW